ncbi:hypothetical protein, partial [Salmonella sp. s51228]|uniref:hypothetical protein n=1 Tax=Salmonella sp. s51228 TaxID=3159652 RepID=UPI003980A001
MGDPGPPGFYQSNNNKKYSSQSEGSYQRIIRTCIEYYNEPQFYIDGEEQDNNYRCDPNGGSMGDSVDCSCSIQKKF